MAQVGVDEVIWGRLTDAMRVPDGGTRRPGRVHPPPGRAGGGVPAGPAARAGEPSATSPRGRAVAPAIEVIDSRYADFRFSLPDVIADNTSAAAFVVGPWQPVPAGLDNLGVLLEVDGRVAQVGSTAAILGDPRRASTRASGWPAGTASRCATGWVFLAGAATAAVPLRPGAHVRAVVSRSLGIGARVPARSGGEPA